jgi:hypothetical protein
MGNSTGKFQSDAQAASAAAASGSAASAAAASGSHSGPSKPSGPSAAKKGEQSAAAKSSVVCGEAIDEIVDKFMANSSINSPLVPDFIERQIYRNALTLALGLAEEVLAGAKLEVLGHRVELRLVSSEQLA